jgi:hypothetical protein
VAGLVEGNPGSRTGLAFGGLWAKQIETQTMGRLGEMDATEMCRASVEMRCASLTHQQAGVWEKVKLAPLFDA